MSLEMRLNEVQQILNGQVFHPSEHRADTGPQGNASSTISRLESELSAAGTQLHSLGMSLSRVCVVMSLVPRSFSSICHIPDGALRDTVTEQQYSPVLGRFC